MTNIIPRSEFDDWAETYDQSVSDWRTFPFTGYGDLMNAVVSQAQVRPGMSVLDLGTGTGNLALPFAQAGCSLWCTDFSEPMLAKTRQKIPTAHFILHDLRTDLPPELEHPFDCIVSAYVFHHFDLEEKVRILRLLLPRLATGGRMLIGDIAFRNRVALEKVKAEVGQDWEDEFYWLVDDAMPALRKAGIQMKYRQISSCAGVFVLSTL